MALTMADIRPSFTAFLAKYGMRVWRETADERSRRHHGRDRCPCPVPALLGGASPCDACEADFADTMLKLALDGPWAQTRGSPSTRHGLIRRHRPHQ